MSMIGNAGRHVSGLATLALCAMLVAAPDRAAAQTRERDARWQPWLGCWTPAATQTGLSSDAAAQQVCIVPADGTSAVDIVTVSGNRVLAREHIDASGEHRANDRDGCSGWESATWSSDERRVYLQSESRCARGLDRRTTGLVAMAPNGDWLDIVGVTVRDNTGVRVLRHYTSEPLATLPADVASALETRSRAAEAARIASAVWPIDTSEIVDASQHVSAGVVEAWLAESRQTFAIDAKRLLELAKAGVDARVTDMLIALSYPKAFAIKPSPSTIGALAVREGGGGGGAGDLGGFGSLTVCSPYAMGLSVYGWDGCSIYGSAMYPIYGARQYGYSTYGDLYGYGAGYFADRGSVVVIRPSDATASSHGQVINGRGYSAGAAGADSSGTASASSGSSSSTASSGGGGAAGSSGGDRTAVPR